LVIICLTLTLGCESPLNTDDDGEGEPDGLPLSEDFDGDGYSNDDELYTYGFDPDSDPYKFNPMVADVPRIRISLASAPQITLHVSSTETGSTEITTGTQSGYSEEVTRSESHSTSTAIETVVSEHRDTVSLGPITLSSPQGTRDTSRTTTEEESFTWSDSQSVTNSQMYSEAQSIRQEQGFTYSGGELKVSVKIENTGHIAYTLSNLSLSAHEYRFFGLNTLNPVGNLEFDSTSGDFPATTLGPGDTLGPFVFIKNDLPLDTALSLWNDSRGLVVRPSTYQLTDANDVSFNHHLTTIMARTATVIVDYGPSVARPTEHHSVATNVDPADPGVTFAEALDEHLYLPYQTDADGLISVRGEEGVPTNNTEWLVTHLYTVGGQDRYDIYSAQEDSVELDGLTLKAGNVLHLTYMDDSDGDGLYTREELFHGTLPDNPDSDGDGLLDGEEVHGYEVSGVTIGGASIRSDPTELDSDGDGTNDGNERHDGTDPTSLFPVTLEGADGFDSNKESTVNDAALDAYGNLYLVGQRNRVTGTPAMSTWAVRKYGPDGTAPDGWGATHHFVGDTEGEHSAEAVAIGPDGSVYAVGYFMDGHPNPREKWGIKKFHPSGEEITAGWDKVIASGENARAHAVAVDNSGNVYVAGYNVNMGGTTTGKDWMILKFDPDGNQDVVDVFDDGNRDDVASAIAVDANGNMIVAGYSTDSGGTRFWRVRKYTSAGALSWDETFEQAGQDTEAMDVVVDGSNNIYVAGYETDAAGSKWRIKKYSSGGQEDLSWDIEYSRAPGGNRARAVTTDSAGNVYVVGYEQGQVQGDTNWRIIRYTPSGYPGDGWSFNYIGQSHISANAVAVSQDGQVYVAGDRHTGGDPGDSYWHIRKYYGIIE